MSIYGYARVSTLDQDLGIQRAALKAAGCSVICAENVSGSRPDGRTELRVLLCKSAVGFDADQRRNILSLCISGGSAICAD